MFHNTRMLADFKAIDLEQLPGLFCTEPDETGPGTLSQILESVAECADQLLTPDECDDGKKSLEYQDVTGDKRLGQDAGHTLLSNGTVSHQPTRKRCKRRTRRRGGWKTTRTLDRSEVRQIDDFAWKARVNFLITISPPKGVSDAEGKRFISHEIAKLGQVLKRRGQDHVGVTIHEKNPDEPHLHAHHLVVVDPANRDVVERWASCKGVARHAKPIQARDIHKVVAYCTKQRRPWQPDIERRIGRQRVAPVPIVGKRWSMTTAARRLMAI